jgi:hypothetical protein
LDAEEVDEFEYKKHKFVAEQASLYAAEGWAPSVARSKIFLNLTILIILCNAFYLGVASHKDAEKLYESPLSYIIIENLFCCYFCVELLIRFLAFRNADLIFRDFNFLFDAFLTVLLALETWIVPILAGEINVPTEAFRLVRLLRLARMRVCMTSFPELLTMTRGMIKGARACLASVAMIALLNYVLALATLAVMKRDHEMNEKLAGLTNGLSFHTLFDCMWIFLVCGTFTLDGSGVVLTELALSPKVNHSLACFFLFGYLLLTNMIICNMLIGVLCTIMTEAADTEREVETSSILRRQVFKQLLEYDNGNGLINKEALSSFLHTTDSKQLCADLDIDRVFLQAVAFHNGCDSIPIVEVMDLMLGSRRGAAATVHTISASLAYLTSKLNHMHDDAAREHWQSKNLDISAYRRRTHNGSPYRNGNGSPYRNGNVPSVNNGNAPGLQAHRRNT